MRYKKLFEGKIIKRRKRGILTDKNELLVLAEAVDYPPSKFEYVTKWILNDCVIMLPNGLGVDVINRIDKDSGYYGFDIEEDIECFLPGYLDDNFAFQIFSSIIGSCALGSDVVYDNGLYILHNEGMKLIVDADFYRIVEEYYKSFDRRFYISFDGDIIHICADTPHTFEWVDIEIMNKSEEINIWNLLPFNGYNGSDELVEELNKYLKCI